MPESKAAPKKSRADTGGEKVIEIPLAELHPFKNHPFKVKDDDAMMETADSIRQYGVLVPVIARPSPEGGYEIIAGHRRHRASELAEKETIPVIVRSLDDGGAGHLLGEEWHHPSGDRVSGQPSRTSHAGGSDIGAVAGCKLCAAGFYKRLIENGGQLPFGGWPRFFFCRKLQKAFVKSFSYLENGVSLHSSSKRIIFTRLHQCVAVLINQGRCFLCSPTKKR